MAVTPPPEPSSIQVIPSCEIMILSPTAINRLPPKATPVKPFKAEYRVVQVIPSGEVRIIPLATATNSPLPKVTPLKELECAMELSFQATPSCDVKMLPG